MFFLTIHYGTNKYVILNENFFLSHLSLLTYPKENNLTSFLELAALICMEEIVLTTQKDSSFLTL